MGDKIILNILGVAMNTKLISHMVLINNHFEV